MDRPTNEAVDRALSLLALGLNDGHGPSYNFFDDSNAHGSPEQLDRDVRLMRAVQSSLNDRISALISKRHTYRNTIAPRIHTIPLEIFIRILSESTPLEIWSVENLNRLARVSKHWSSVILSTPQLWAFVSYNDSKGDLDQSWKLALRKSNPLPISCLICLYTPGDLPVLARVSEESHRWKSMIYKGPMSPEAIEFLQSPCPRLEQLAITAQYSQTLVNLNTSFGEHLRSVELTCVSLLWDECVLRNLEILSLHMDEDWELNEWPSPRQILGILSRSPRLKVLDLRGVHQYNNDRRVPRKITKEIVDVGHVIMPCLRSLTVVKVPLAIPISIFTKTHAPFVHDFHWERGSERSTPEYLSLHHSEQSGSVPGRVLAGMTSGNVTVYLKRVQPWGWGIRINTYDEDDDGAVPRFKTQLRAETSDLGNVFDFFMISSVITNLVLEINCYPCDDTFPPSLLDRVPGVRELRLYRVSNTAEILSYLSSRSRVGQRWPCPLMTHLTIAMSDLSPDAVASFKSARYPDHPTPDADGLQVPLVSLVVHG